jgi:hypothetical protein
VGRARPVAARQLMTRRRSVLSISCPPNPHGAGLSPSRCVSGHCCYSLKTICGGAAGVCCLTPPHPHSWSDQGRGLCGCVFHAAAAPVVAISVIATHSPRQPPCLHGHHTHPGEPRMDAHRRRQPAFCTRQQCCGMCTWCGGCEGVCQGAREWYRFAPLPHTTARCVPVGSPFCSTVVCRITPSTEGSWREALLHKAHHSMRCG